MLHHQPTEPEKAAKPGGPRMVVTPKYTDVAGVIVQALADGSNQWGLAVLWYDKEQCSWPVRALRLSKLSQSKVAATQIGEVVLRQGGRTFPPQDQTGRPT